MKTMTGMKAMKTRTRRIAALVLAAACASLAGCEDPQVYGSVGFSTGYSHYGYGGWGSGMHSSISIGGRIR
ncbi:MAG TPA: hypothetical protein DD491_01895 [Halieaceae bacterium]|nr:hypothetical protein [Halieaceae bacterium]